MIQNRLSRWQSTSFLIAGAASALCLAGWMVARQQFFQSYLFAFIFWFGLAMGCLALLMLHHVVGGAWGDLPRPMMEAAVMTLPWLALLFLPVIAGFSYLYAWADPATVAADPLLQHKHVYLNVPFVIVRAALFFAFWSFLGWRLNRAADRGDRAASERARRLSAPGLFLYMLTVSFAMIDWLMTLEPHWYSTIFGAMMVIGFVLGAIALLIVGLRLFSTAQDRAALSSSKPFLDLGNLLLAFVMMWAYFGFSQYLIIWSANIPEEIVWYLHRQEKGWFWVALSIVGFQFVLPFAILLGRRNKQRLERLARIAGLILLVHVLATFWFIVPSFHPSGLRLHWLDAAAFLAVGGFWSAVWLGRLKRAPAPIGISPQKEIDA